MLRQVVDLLQSGSGQPTGSQSNQTNGTGVRPSPDQQSVLSSNAAQTPSGMTPIGTANNGRTAVDEHRRLFNRQSVN